MNRKVALHAFAFALAACSAHADVNDAARRAKLSDRERLALMGEEERDRAKRVDEARAEAARGPAKAFAERPSESIAPTKSAAGVIPRHVEEPARPGESRQELQRRKDSLRARDSAIYEMALPEIEAARADWLAKRIGADEAMRRMTDARDRAAARIDAGLAPAIRR